MNSIAWLLFVVAALLEVGGDASIRRCLRGGGMAFIVAGCVALSCYGLVVNCVKWDFSRLIGVYVGFFALVSILVGRTVFKESISSTTWLGLALILVGGMVIQFGQR
jgi:small multidrug resistance family-3 protein